MQKFMEKIYLKNLDKLIEKCTELPNTIFCSKAKILAFIILNVRYEAIMKQRCLKCHPYKLVVEMVDASIAFLESICEISFLDSKEEIGKPFGPMEAEHEDLFQKLWVNFNESEYQNRIDRFVHRIKINKLESIVRSSKIIDFGCGHGNFAHALIQCGANFVKGVDFGKDSINYAKNARDKLGVSEEVISFEVASVYKTKEPSGFYDFAIQNGVFHHLENDDLAYREVYRVLKPNGKFWIYTDGSGAISHDLWDYSRKALEEIPSGFILDFLTEMGVETNKRYHLDDGLNAVYKHMSLEDLTSRLGRIGFKFVRRLVGGYDTDFDHDVIEKDYYGIEKFGSGDIRILVQKVS